MDSETLEEEEKPYTQQQVISWLQPFAIREFPPDENGSIRLVFLENYLAHVEADGSYLFCKEAEFFHLSPLDFAKIIRKVCLSFTLICVVFNFEIDSMGCFCGRRIDCYYSCGWKWVLPSSEGSQKGNGSSIC